MTVKHLVGRRGIGFTPGSVKYIITLGLDIAEEAAVIASAVWELPAQTRFAALPEQIRIPRLSRQSRTWNIPERI